MAKDLVLDVIAKKNSKELSQLADEFDRLSKQTDDFGKKLNNTSTFSRFLDDELKKTKQTVKELGLEFQATGNKDVFAKLKGAQSNLRQLENISKQLRTSLTSGLEEAGTEGVQGFSQALIKAWPITLPIAAALGTELLAAVGGGVLGVAGGGALATGIALQLKSPTVHAAVSDLGSFVKGELTDSTDVFFQPLMAGIDELKQGLGPALNDLRPAFKEIAPYVELFGRELGHAAQVFAPMFASALKDSAPILGIIAHELPTLAKGFGDFFEQIGHGAKGGGEALDTFIKALSLGLSGLGYIIRGAENAFDGFIQALDKVLGVATGVVDFLAKLDPVGGKAKDAMHGLNDYVHGVATSFDDGKITASGFSDAIGPGGLTTSALGAAGAMQQLDQATLIWKNDALDSRDATLTFKDALANLKDQLNQNGAGFNENTQAGRQNVEALNQLAHSAQDVADKTYAATGNSQQAAQAYKQARDQVLELAKQGHATTDEIAALNAALDRAVTIRKGEVDIEVNLTGSGKALVTNQGTVSISGGLVKARAGGGPVVAGEPYIVGEHGPELLVPGDNGYVVPADQTAALMGGGTGGAAAGAMDRIQIDLTLNGEIIRSILVNHARRSGFRTVDALLPVGSAR